MAQKIVDSGKINFLDYTDLRKVEVYISSTLPTSQIYNGNTNKYTPDWTETNLELSADVFLDSQEITAEKIQWFTKINNVKEQITNVNGSLLTIKENILNSHGIVTFICEATYQGILGHAEITFTRVDTGIDGTSGKDGTSITILGTYDSLEALKAVHPTGNAGDSYIVQGNLWVWAIDDAEWENVGNIQGTPGKDGQDAKAIFLNANAQIFKVSKTGAVLPTTIKVTAQPVNTSITSYTYSIDGGQTFSSNAPSGVSRSGNQITIAGTSMTASSVTIMATDGQYQDTFTVYKVSDGSDGTPGADGKPAPIAFLTNESIGFAANSKGQVSATSAVTNVVAFVGTSSVKPTIGTLSGVPEGMSITQEEVGNEILLTLNITNNSTLGSSTSNGGRITIPVTIPTTPAITTNLQLGWNKVNAGRSVSSIAARYAVSNSNTTAPTSWNVTIPIRGEGQYLWMADYITYDDGTNATVGPRVVTGDSGTPGISIGSVVSYFANNQSQTSAPAITATWTTTPTRQTGYYTWRKDLIMYSDNTSEYTTPVCITGDQGDKGVDGTTYYTWIKYADTPTSGMHDSPTGKAYMGIAYNKTTATESTNYSDYNWSLIKGADGTPASLVHITPSALYFKSTTGRNGTFTPEYIYLYPNFQTVSYSNWQYSTNGGSTWASVANANGLTVGTYNSVANSLRISRASTLYTDSITSISFRCNSNNAAIYDIVSIAKIYDSIDLQIGGTNFIPQSKMDQLPTAWAGGNGFTMVTEDGYQCARLDGVIGASIAPNVNITDKMNLTDITQEYTVSAWVKVVNYVGGTTNPFFALYFSGYKASDNTWLGATNVKDSGDLGRFNNAGWKKLTWTLKFDSLMSRMLFYVYVRDMTGTLFIRDIKVEKGNTATDWSPAPEDIIAASSNTSVMLSNESHLFVANPDGVPIEETVSLDIVGYQGATQKPTTIGTITGIVTGLTATISNNNTTNAKIAVSVAATLTHDKGVLTIPVTVDGKTINKMFSWAKTKNGADGKPGDDAVIFQVYSEDGYILSKNNPKITLKTFAYIGDTPITADVAYQWYNIKDGVTTAISGATGSSYDIHHTDVSFTNSYMCVMTFKGVDYSGVVTIDDKNDVNTIFSSKPTSYAAGDIWVVGSDYAPAGHEIGTVLRAEHTNNTYNESDWVTATKYDKHIKALEDDITQYNQYFSFDSQTGLRISARDSNGNASQFSTTLSNDRLSFNQGDESVAYIESNKLKIKEAEIVSPLTVTGKYSGSTMQQAPIINIGNFSIVVESNGSLSIVANT